MTSLSLALVLQASILAAGGDAYAEARRVTAETGRPMVIMVGADWCPACMSMKQNVIPEIKQRGSLRNVTFAFVNLDKQHKLGRELVRDGPIPQLLMFRKTSTGWKLRRLIGAQSVNTVESFIDRGIELDKATKMSKGRRASIINAGFKRARPTGPTPLASGR